MEALSVKLKAPLDEATIAELTALSGATDTGSRIAPLRLFRLEADDDTVWDAKAKLERDPRVERVTLTFLPVRDVLSTYLNTIANDPLLKNQWHLWRHGFFRAWRYTIGDPSIKIGWVDSGCAVGPNSFWAHPDVPLPAPENRWNAQYGTQNCDDPQPGEIVDLYGDNEHWEWFCHGMHTMGIVVGSRNNARGTSGAAPGLTPIMTVPIVQTGKPFPYGLAWDTYQSARCILHCQERGARVINNSWGGWAVFDPPTWEDVRDAIEYVWGLGCILVAAAGNDHFDLGNLGPYVGAIYPSMMEHVVTVGGIGGVDKSQTFGDAISMEQHGWWGSNYGAPIDITALASDDLSANIAALPQSPSEDYRYDGGTSFASPLVSAALGLMLSINPDLTNEEAIALLYESIDGPHDNGDNYRANFPNAGILNAHKAVLRTLTTLEENAGLVYPVVQFYGPGVVNDIVGGIPRETLHGSVFVELGAYSTDEIAAVELWLGDQLLYSGLPTTLQGDALSAGNPLALRIVARTVNDEEISETYDDVIVDSLALFISADPLHVSVGFDGNATFIANPMLMTHVALGFSGDAIAREIGAREFPISMHIEADAEWDPPQYGATALASILGLLADAAYEPPPHTDLAFSVGFDGDAIIDETGDKVFRIHHDLWADAWIAERPAYLPPNEMTGLSFLAGPWAAWSRFAAAPMPTDPALASAISDPARWAAIAASNLAAMPDDAAHLAAVRYDGYEAIIDPSEREA